jgi:alcohol dehydrogenase class IV
MKSLILGARTLITGSGSIGYLAALQKARVFIVTGGKSMTESGVIARIETMLRQNDCQTELFSGIKPNPDTEIIENGLAGMRAFRPDIILAVGGGSSLDAAKVMALLYEYPDIDFTNILTRPLPEKRTKLTFIAIPSTSGTGSEVTKAAVVTFRDTSIKIGIKTPAFLPDVAILDADLTMSMPGHVVAETGMDAVTHAVECYINHNLDDFTECMARGAIEGLFTYLPLSYKDQTIESREKVHHFQSLAGIAFDNVGLGMTHGIAHAVGGMFDLGHGLINAIALPYVLAFNSRDPKVKEKLRKLANSIGQEDFIEAVIGLNRKLGIPASFKDAGLDRDWFEKEFSRVAGNAMKGATRVNPATINEREMAQLLQNIYAGNNVAGVAGI